MQKCANGGIVKGDQTLTLFRFSRCVTVDAVHCATAAAYRLHLD